MDGCGTKGIVDPDSGDLVDVNDCMGAFTSLALN